MNEDDIKIRRELNTPAALKAIQYLAGLPPIPAAKEACELLDGLADGPEEDHLSADEIVVRYLKGKGQAGNDVALSFLYARYRSGFYYA